MSNQCVSNSLEGANENEKCAASQLHSVAPVAPARVLLPQALVEGLVGRRCALPAPFKRAIHHQEAPALQHFPRTCTSSVCVCVCVVCVHIKPVCVHINP
jgi:hypothetical protein